MKRPAFFSRLRDEDRERLRQWYRTEQDFGQADYSKDYGYDPERRTGYRRTDPARPDHGQADYDRDYVYDPKTRTARRRAPGEADARSWEPEATDYRGVGPRAYQSRDRRLWVEVNERLTLDRDLDASGIEVTVRDAEVILDGVVVDRAAKHRAEDLADLPGARHVQSNLRIRP